MFTEASNFAELVQDTVADERARRLLYQMRVNLELFKQSTEHLDEAFNTLTFHDFARVVGGCHMDEGIFGTAKHTAEMMAAKERVVSFLLSTVTAGHRFARAARAARANDRGTDWKELRTDLDALDRDYHRVRNFLEHLDEAIAKGALDVGVDCSFSKMRVLTCVEPPDRFTFDFTPESLKTPADVYEKVVALLAARKVRDGATAPS